MLHLFLSNNEYVFHLHCIFSFIFLFLFLGPFLCVVRTIHFERVSSLSLRKIKWKNQQYQESITSQVAESLFLVSLRIFLPNQYFFPSDKFSLLINCPFHLITSRRESFHNFLQNHWLRLQRAELPSCLLLFPKWRR